MGFDGWALASMGSLMSSRSTQATRLATVLLATLAVLLSTALCRQRSRTRSRRNLCDWVAVFGVVHLRQHKLPVERLPVGDAASQELWPGRNRDCRVNLLGEEAPEFWMMPAQVMAAAVAVRTDSGSQALDLGDQGDPVQGLEVIIQVLAHAMILPAADDLRRGLGGRAIHLHVRRPAVDPSGEDQGAPTCGYGDRWYGDVASAEADWPVMAIACWSRLGWSAQETADALEGSVAAVNSALQRARARLRELGRPGRLEWSPLAPPTQQERRLVQRYMDAHARADAAAVIELLGDDVRASSGGMLNRTSSPSNSITAAASSCWAMTSGSA